MGKSNAMGWLGFDSRNARLVLSSGVKGFGLLNPGEYAQVDSCPQIPFRGERLFVWSKVAPNFLIRDVYVGIRTMLVSAGAGLPADAFSTRMDRLAQIEEVFEKDKVFHLSIEKNGEELLGSAFLLPTASPGMRIVLGVENIGDEPLRFLAGFQGTIPEGFL